MFTAIARMYSDADVRAAACLLEAIPRPGQTLARGNSALRRAPNWLIGPTAWLARRRTQVHVRCNVLGGALEQGTDPLTGFYRDGCCAAGPRLVGTPSAPS